MGELHFFFFGGGGENGARDEKGRMPVPAVDHTESLYRHRRPLCALLGKSARSRRCIGSPSVGGQLVEQAGGG